MEQKFKFVERTGTFVHYKRENGLFMAFLKFYRGTKYVDFTEGRIRFDGHWIDVVNCGSAVAILGSEIAQRNPLPGRISRWDENTRTFSLLPQRTTYLEVGQGLLTHPDFKSRNFLLWTLTLA